ncbi:uncharacterized protein F5891DRAFT_259529 [Suillus fuscotomentosus]|uniref:DUF6533 domain-containing protein n=1 Tax=Suillus fuscotomentosus TaxID=1912939 RepID=A0AAD4DNY8_9AGAM|nr:uncharacterized protein F5891DRAFT_259529 [Suillus fuscotomentosus]KAG1887399.1 hypothetical protein F5891DRAFT_259529 [Suillus fuscotomentosus]
MSVSNTFGLQLAKYTNVAASALLIYDYFITSHSEVQWTWGRKWGIIRITFTLSRYVPFAGAFMTSYSAVKTWGTQDCAPFNDAVNGLHFVGIIASEGLLIARVHAFSGNKKANLIVLLSFGLTIMVTCVVLSAAPIHFSNPEAGPPCTLEGARSSAFGYGLLMIFEIVLMLITVFVKYRHYFGFHNTLIRSVYGDGLLYMSCITMVSTLNVIVISVFPLSYSEMLNVPQIVVHSVLASRILFSLQANREQSVIPTYLSTNAPEMQSLPDGFQAWYEGRETFTDAGQLDQA